MKLTKKVRLIIPKNYLSTFHKYMGSSRYAYNYAIKNDINMMIKEGDLRKKFTLFKKEIGNEWMYDINNNVFKQGIRDYYVSKKNYFKNKKGRPKLKKKRYNKGSFYIDVLQIKILKNKVYIPSIGWFNYTGDILDDYNICKTNGIVHNIGTRPSNPRVVYDGLYFYLNVTYDIEDKNFKIKDINNNLTIGIDLGLETFSTICYRKMDKVNKTIKNTYKKFKTKKKKFKKLLKRKKRLDRKISKRNKEYKELIKKGETVNKSYNYFKLLRKRIKLSHKMTNIQKDYIYKIIAKIVKTKPSTIVIEDLNIKGMMKNNRLSKWIQFNQFYTFKRILEYKCKLYGINLIIANRFFPSSKLCSKCGNKKDKLLLSDRIYYCNSCNNVMDRDNNASKNLAKYPKIIKLNKTA